MGSLRTLLILLVILNLLAFAGLQGWLGRPSTKGEPERLTNQLNPERIKLRAPPAAAGEVGRTQAPAGSTDQTAPVPTGAAASASFTCCPPMSWNKCSRAR